MKAPSNNLENEQSEQEYNQESWSKSLVDGYPHPFGVLKGGRELVFSNEKLSELNKRLNLRDVREFIYDWEPLPRSSRGSRLVSLLFDPGLPVPAQIDFFPIGENNVYGIVFRLIDSDLSLHQHRVDLLSSLAGSLSHHVANLSTVAFGYSFVLEDVQSDSELDVGAIAQRLKQSVERCESVTRAAFDLIRPSDFERLSSVGTLLNLACEIADGAFAPYFSTSLTNFDSEADGKLIGIQIPYVEGLHAFLEVLIALKEAGLADLKIINEQAPGPFEPGDRLGEIKFVAKGIPAEFKELTARSPRLLIALRQLRTALSSEAQLGLGDVELRFEDLTTLSLCFTSGKI